MYQQKYPPPLIPPRGEVNAADAFDIGSFDEEDTKGWTDFSLVVVLSSMFSFFTCSPSATGVGAPLGFYGPGMNETRAYLVVALSH